MDTSNPFAQNTVTLVSRVKHPSPSPPPPYPPKKEVRKEVVRVREPINALLWWACLCLGVLLAAETVVLLWYKHHHDACVLPRPVPLRESPFQGNVPPAERVAWGLVPSMKTHLRNSPLRSLLCAHHLEVDVPTRVCVLASGGTFFVMRNPRVVGRSEGVVILEYVNEWGGTTTHSLWGEVAESADAVLNEFH